METFYTITINFIFYTILIQIIITLIFYFFKLSKNVLLNCLTVLITIIPLFLQYNHYNHFFFSYDLSRVTAAGLFIFPITYSLIIKNQFIKYLHKNLIPVYILTILCVILYAVLPYYNDIIIFILYLFLYLFVIFMILPGRSDISVKMLLLILVLNIIYISITLYTLDFMHFIISSGLISIISFFIIAFSLMKRIVSILNKYNNINDLNRKLTHRVSRMKQSNDQCKKIILEKDLELFQMARHASLAELTTGIAHELSQPLTGIKGIAQNMVDDINYEEFENLQAVSELLKICSLVDKSSSIIDHIRTFSRKSFLTMKPVDLNKVVLDALALINLQLKKNNIDIIFVLDDNVPKIIGDKISLEQLVLNIILNSKDAILERKFELNDQNGSIRITTSYTDNSVKMLIEDNGAGISKDIIQKIWSPFFTTKKRGNGTGIGLSICNKILNDHNAVIEIESEKTGTIFSISFPVDNSKQDLV